MRTAGMNMGQVKVANRSTILNYINASGPVSRKDIADATGLTPAAVTQICGDFLKEGILQELGTSEESTGAGRKKVLVDIDWNYAYIYSVNIEVEKTVVALTNLSGRVLAKTEMETDRDLDPTLFLKSVARACLQIGQAQKPSVKKKISAVSIGIPGIVDRERGLSIHAYGIWKEEVKVCRIFEDELELDAYIDNNVNAFAKATLLFGVGRRYDNLLVIKWGPGVGSTIVIDNAVYDGRRGKAAELGHFIVEKDGKACSCGRRGCLETKVSYKALNEIVSFDTDGFGQAYRTSNPEDKEKLQEEIDLFARTIVNSMTILAPNRVVLSGFLFQDSDIRDEFISCCKHYESKYDEKRIVYTELSECEDYIGPVASFVKEEIF